MKYMKKIYVLLILASLFSACHHDDDAEEEQDPERTVLIYLAAENNLSSFAEDDLREMKTASKSLNNRQQLIAYVDKAESTPPFFARIKDGQFVDSVSVEESITADPAVLEKALRYMRTNYPAKSYGLVLWGHASGWLISKDSVVYDKSRAYGGDTGSNSSTSSGRYWMNIPSMARAIANGMESTPLTFIMGDCCSFGCVEIAYELRQVAEYIIGSPAEVPDEGAPFDLIIPDMFSTSTEFYKAILDHYYNYYLEAYQKGPNHFYNNTKGDLVGYSVPLVAVRTSELETLATVTAKLLGTISETLTPEGTLNFTNRVFYAYSNDRYSYDMYNMLKANTSGTDFNTWATAFQKAVPYYLYSAHWLTYYRTQIGSEMGFFEGQDADCGVLSMFFPRIDYRNTNWNTTIQQLQWNNIIQWQQYGW
jgi:hypothetical protein